MQITILSVTVEHVPGKNGGYKKAEVAYKDEQGKVAGKKIMSFVNPVVFNAVSEAQSGEVFTIESEKDNNGYWQWTKATKGATSQVVAKAPGTPSPRSTYETPEERAKKQIYIVRQSSVASAIQLLSSNGGKKNTPEEVINIASQFEKYVFGEDFDDGSVFSMKDDVPFEVD